MSGLIRYFKVLNVWQLESRTVALSGLSWSTTEGHCMCASMTDA
jgi:hypothetical protein